MKALITGGAGFIGSHLAEALISRGDEVFVIDDLSTGLYRNIAPLVGRKGFRHVIDSCASPAVLEEAMDACDVVYHLAAAVGVELIIARPVETIERNVHLTEVVLHEAAARGRRVIFTSTSEVYGKGVKVPFAEDDDVVLGPSTRARWGYACSKLLDEFLACAYGRERNLRVTILRLFNTVGPRQTGRYGMVLPRFVEAAVAGKPLTVFGDGEQTRCFCDVADVVRALVDAAEEPRVLGEVVNIGSEAEISIRALAERVRAIVNPFAPIELVPYDKAYAPGFEDMRRRVPDTKKAERLLGWRPRIPLETTVRRMVEWLKA